MLPTEDAEWVGAELARRFGLPLWSFTLTATDANRWAIRLARLATGRPKILTFAYCYHGSVDEAFAVPGPDGEAVARAGQRRRTRAARRRRPGWRSSTTSPGSRSSCAHGDVAGDPHRAGADQHRHRAARAGLPRRAARARHPVRRAADDRRDAHVLGRARAARPRAWDLRAGHLRDRQEHRRRHPERRLRPDPRGRRAASPRDPEADLVDVGGVGGTLAGNALSVAAMRATLEHVLTEEAFERMIDAGHARSRPACRTPSTRTGLPWTRQPARRPRGVPVRLPRAARPAASRRPPATTSSTSTCTCTWPTGASLITPFHNMALMCPDTTAEDVDLHTGLFAEAVAALVAGSTAR